MSRQPLPSPNHLSRDNDVVPRRVVKLMRPFLRVSRIGGRQERKERPKTDNDEMYHYGFQVAANMRRLSTYHQHIAKLRIEEIFLELEFPQLPSPPTYYDLILHY